MKLPVESEAELRIFASRIEEATVKLGRADFQVALAEQARNAARGELATATAQLQAFIEEAGKKLKLEGPWRFDPVTRAFTKHEAERPSPTQAA